MVIFICGEDTYSAREYLRQVRTQYAQKYADAAVTAHDAAEDSWGDIAASLTAVGLFSQRRLVIVRNPFFTAAVRDGIVAVLDSGAIADDVTVVLFEPGKPDARQKLVKRLLKEKYATEFALRDARGMERFITQRAGQLGARIEPSAARALGQLVGQDTWRASTEVEKLAHACAGTITEQAVKEFTLSSFEDDIWQFIDAISAKRKKQALGLLEDQFQLGVEPLYLLSMLARQIRLLIALSGAFGDDRSVALDLGLHPFVVKKTRQQAQQFTQQQLRVFHAAIARLDRALKEGRGEPKLLFTILVDAMTR